MKVIGLTGGIGAGKSTVSDYLKKQNITILDADEISRNLTKKGGEALPEIMKTFGLSVFNEEGELDRRALADVVFNDTNKRKILERITTDLVVKKINEKIDQFRDKGELSLVIIDAPLLFECGCEKICDEVWVVISNLESRIKRVIERDHLTREEIISRINNQMSDENKLKLADKVLDNSKGLDYLYDQIDNLLRECIARK